MEIISKVYFSNSLFEIFACALTENALRWLPQNLSYIGSGNTLVSSGKKVLPYDIRRSQWIDNANMLKNYIAHLCDIYV